MVVDCAAAARPASPAFRAAPTMQDKLTLMIPGPTPVPETVLQALARHPIGKVRSELQKFVMLSKEHM
jgi:aspartate aminotransferase-like enzyme